MVVVVVMVVVIVVMVVVVVVVDRFSSNAVTVVAVERNSINVTQLWCKTELNVPVCIVYHNGHSIDCRM